MQSAELASVYMIDIVGFTKLNPSQQLKALSTLQSAVTRTKAYREERASGNLIALPTGDGMILAFKSSHPSVAAECATSLARRLRRAFFEVRAGIHHGTVYTLRDINGSDNINGHGINFAQRVMSCAAPGEIALSAAVAEALQATVTWHERVRGVGKQRVKHCVLLELFLLDLPGASAKKEVPVSGPIRNGLRPDRAKSSKPAIRRIA